jgi:hypothetical protein
LLILLAKTTLDHIPYVVQIGTKISNAIVFRCENYWIKHPGFFDVVTPIWHREVRASSSLAIIVAKFKIA